LNNWSYSRLRKLSLGSREGDGAWPSSEQLSLLGENRRRGPSIFNRE
jgi:hypothetical protein